MLGARGQSAIATLVERQTRYVMLLAVGRNKTSHHVCALIAKKIRTLPQHLAVSLTWDRGKEMARHRQFSIATGVHVYFCDPSSPWQRGSNENTNGLRTKIRTVCVSTSQEEATCQSIASGT